jgi:hypothetical protein
LNRSLWHPYGWNRVNWTFGQAKWVFQNFQFRAEPTKIVLNAEEIEKGRRSDSRDPMNCSELRVPINCSELRVTMNCSELRDPINYSKSRVPINCSDSRVPINRIRKELKKFVSTMHAGSHCHRIELSGGFVGSVMWYFINLISSCPLWPPLWSSGQSSWLQIRRPGFDSRHYQKNK